MKEDFESVSFETVWFCHKLYIRLPRCPKPSATADFFKYCFDNLCFQLMQNVTWPNETKCMVRHKWGKIGPSYLLSQHGDPAFLFHFLSIITTLGQSLKKCMSWVLFWNNDLKALFWIICTIYMNALAKQYYYFLLRFWIHNWYCNCYLIYFFSGPNTNGSQFFVTLAPTQWLDGKCLADKITTCAIKDNNNIIIIITLFKCQSSSAFALIGDTFQARIGIWKCWFLRRGENRSTQGKTSRSREENQQQIRPTYDAGSGNRTRDTLVGGERSHRCGIHAPHRHPCSPSPF